MLSQVNYYSVLQESYLCNVWTGAKEYLCRSMTLSWQGKSVWVGSLARQFCQQLPRNELYVAPTNTVEIRGQVPFQVTYQLRSPWGHEACSTSQPSFLSFVQQNDSQGSILDSLSNVYKQNEDSIAWAYEDFRIHWSSASNGSVDFST